MADRWQDYQGYVCADWLNEVDWLLDESAGKPKTPSQLRENIGAVEEAPVDGGEYVRQDGGWVANSGGGGAIAHNATTDRTAADCHPTSAVTGLDATLADKVNEAPVDGQNYVRKNATWNVLPASGGGPIDHNETNQRDAANCHPIAAITDLTTTLAAKAEITYVDAGLATKADTTDLDGYTPEAPLDGSQYGRQSGAWTQIVAGGGGNGETNIQPNLIMNSGFHVNQRNRTLIAAPQVAGSYLVDRWRWKTSSSIQYAQLKTTSGSVVENYSFHWNNPLYYEQALSDGTVQSADLAVLEHPIEGHDFRGTLFGTPDAKNLVLSFTAVNSDVTGGTFTMSVGIQNGDRDRCYMTTVAVSTTKSRFSVSIPGDTQSDWYLDDRVGAWVFFTFVAGAAHQRSTLAAWEDNDDYAHDTQSNLTTSPNGPKVFVSDVKLEVNTEASAYRNERQADELLRCQRYYWSLTEGQSVSDYADIEMPMTRNFSGDRELYLQFPTRMRQTPTIAVTAEPSGGVFSSGMPKAGKTTKIGCVVEGDLNTTTAAAILQTLTADAEYTG